MILPSGSKGDVVTKPRGDVYTSSFTEKVLSDEDMKSKGVNNGYYCWNFRKS
jgi:hypothetical protein